MFLQQYIAWWHYDYALSTTTLSMQLSTSNTLTGAYIGAGAYTAASDPFLSNAGTVQNLQVTADSTTMRTTIKANLGYQGEADFDVNFLGQYVQAYSTDCMQSFGGTQPIACNLYPSFADLYFNSSGYTQQDPVTGEYGGYNTSGYFYNSSICLTSQNQSLFCTVDNDLFAVSDTIMDNNWNYGVDGNAG